MAYSFVKVGSSGKDCDIIAQSISDKLYFAGEVSDDITKINMSEIFIYVK